jgi:hypothetical protein
LGNARVFVSFIRAEGIKSPDTRKADDCAEDVGLFEVQIDKFFRFFFNETDSALQVGDSQAGRSGTDRSNPSESKDTVGLAFSVQVYDTVRPHDTGRSIHGQLGQCRYGVFCGSEKKWVEFDTDAFITHCYRRGNCGAAPHERVKHDAGPHRE